MGTLIILASLIYSLAPVSGFCAQPSNSYVSSAVQFKFVAAAPGQNPNPAPADNHPTAPFSLRPELTRPRPVVAPEVFVALNLDLKNHPDSTLKDAVADLGRVAGFRQDLRFAPAAVGAGPDQVALWGWIPSSLVGAVMKVPTVARLEVDTAARRVPPTTATDMLIGVRVPPGRSSSEAMALLQRGSVVPGLRVRRMIGIQAAPGTAETVLVAEVSVPISMLPRLMALHEVVKLAPAPPAPAPVQRPKRQLAKEMSGFLAFVAGQSPMLLALTVLMLLPWVGSGMVAAVRVFVPYR